MRQNNLLNNGPKEMAEIETDFANLARLAAQQAHEDVRLLLARLVRKYRNIRPDLAASLDQTLKASHVRSHAPSVLRDADSLHQGSAATASPVDLDTRLSLLRVFDDVARPMAAPLLGVALQKQVETIIQERQQYERLVAKGISPTSSAIFVGPPGVGKTLTARWIAHQLQKPLWVLDLTTVMSSLLGKTGNNLRLALDYAKQNNAVLLLDEIDAIAKRRGDESDVGELKRLVTVILQEVDHWPDTSLLLAATNHPELIDPALWRRFDSVLTFETPSRDAIEIAIDRFLGTDASLFGAWRGALADAMVGSSLSDVERTISNFRRAAIIQSASPDQLIAHFLAERLDKLDHAQRLAVAMQLAREGNLSHNAISQMTGVARDTIRKHSGPSPRKGRGRK